MLRRINTYLSKRYRASAADKRSPTAGERSPEVNAALQELRRLDLPDNAARAYFEHHLQRLARTLTLVPPPRTSGRILELGCYMQITPFLQRYRGYRKVRGAYYGSLGRTDRKIASVGGEPFEVQVDLFDAERDRFPYSDNSFETVLACELIEHLMSDPMHLLLECRRVLEEAGRLVVTTPNAASLTSVAHALHGYDNPQICALYTRPRPDSPAEVPHVREYTAHELQAVLQAAGFEIESIFTDPDTEHAVHLPIWNLLEENGYNSSLRGEQTYCVAVKRSALPVTRYPRFLYSE
jgi:SAM-dependent methyltransferase